MACCNRSPLYETCCVHCWCTVKKNFYLHLLNCIFRMFPCNISIYGHVTLETVGIVMNNMYTEL